MASEYDVLGTGKFVTAEPDGDGVKLMAAGIEIPTGSEPSPVGVPILYVDGPVLYHDELFSRGVTANEAFELFKTGFVIKMDNGEYLRPIAITPAEDEDDYAEIRTMDFDHDTEEPYEIDLYTDEYPR